MCAIAGIVVAGAAGYRSHLEKMVATLKHRGPDGDGIHLFESCGLAHTRLSIVDLAGGCQPMLTADRRQGISFNGEIYGYQAIRQSLDGYAFRTDGDTEVLLALYGRHGTGMTPHLPGMFSFALWDDAERALFCARDRFGEKPFFYAMGRSGEFVFASEIKGILATGLVDPVLDPAAIRHYLRRGYVQCTGTIYQNIHALPPAHQLVYRDGRVVVSRYWSLPAPSGDIDLVSAAEEFRRLFRQSVSRQLVADVPVGAFLSGGLDSSTIVATASELHARLKTFSFGFGDSINELPFAREIATKYGTDHIELSAKDGDLSALLERMQDVYDEPFGDSSNIPTYLLSKLAREHITVALAGEGGDELTAGYSAYGPLYNLDRARELPDAVAALIRGLAAFYKVCGASLPQRLSSLREGFFMKPHYRTTLQAHLARTASFSETELKGLGLPDVALSSDETGEGLDSALRSDLQEYLPGDILVKTDRASMASGLEIRCPFLDVDFASFCIGLPSRLKMDGHTNKRILREAFGDAWTPSIRCRTKQGFGAPLQDWLKQPGLHALKESVLGNRGGQLFQHVSFEETQRYRAVNSPQTWLLLVLGLWLERRPS